MKNIKTITVLCSLILFAISLTQTAIVIKDFDGNHIEPSYQYFLIGPIAILGGGLFEWLNWLANPAYFISIFLLLKNRRRPAILLSALSICISLSFLFWHQILASEDGRTAEIISFGLGYYLWIAAMLCFFIGIISSTLFSRVIDKPLDIN